MLPTSTLDFELPPDLIATHPAEPRDAARLLVIDRGDPRRMQDRTVRELPELLRPGDLLVFNTTRVLPARFYGERIGTGGRMEGLFLHEVPGKGDAVEWVALIRGRHTRAGAVFELLDLHGAMSGVRLTVVGRPESEPGAWTVRVSGQGERSSAAVLELVGWTPLPPYILRARRGADEKADERLDRERYQTVFADEAGSVAAPTAGLHFTPDLLNRLVARGVRRTDVVLHVGAGTFRPIETEFVEDHPMHPEWCSMSHTAVETIRATKASGARVIPVGTTAARTIESYAAAVEGGGPVPERLETRLLITPGYRFRWTDGILTNFHLPRSTLLAMVAALLPGDGVESVKRAYAHAMAAGYRFYSFGDACLIV